MQTTLYDGSELWRYDTFLRPLQGEIDSYRIISVDIFDTVLFRAVQEPADVFERTGEKAAARGLFRRPIDALEFRALRIHAELVARRRAEPLGHAEATLADIYAELPDSLLDREAVLQLELETEREVCYANPNVVSLLRYAKERGCQIALVSDMYLTSPDMLELLAAAGVDAAWIDELLISCEYKCSKLDGGLFDVLLQAFPELQPSQILHIGDNEAADIKGAASRGIKAVRYGVVPETFDSPFHWERVRHGSVLPAIKSLRKLAAHTLPAEPTAQGEPLDEAALRYYRFGAAFMAPFLEALCEWAIDICVREGYPAIHPLMREAYVLAPMLERIAARRGLELRVIPIAISRQASYLPSLQTVGEAELTYLMSQNWVKVADLFVILDLEAEQGPFRQYAERTLHECSLQLDETGVSVAQRLKEYLLRDEFKRSLQTRIEEQRRRFMGYLSRICGGAAFTGPLVTLDIGFNGTIQHSLQSIARLAGRTLPMVHLMAVGSGRIAELQRSGMDIRCYIGSAGQGGDIAGRIARSPAFLEELMMGRFGSTLKYEEDEAGNVTTMLAELEHDEREFLYKEACQLGIATFQKYYGRFAAAKPGLVPDATAQRREWCLPLHRVIDMPTPEEAHMLGTLTHQDNFCGTRIAPICDAVEDRWFAQGGLHFLDICNYGPAVFSANWPQGTLTGKEPYCLYRYYLQARDQFGRQALLFDMVERLKRDGISVFNIYGTGDLAESLLRVAQCHGLQVHFLIPRPGVPLPRPWGLFEAVDLAAAAAGSVRHYVTATLNEFDLYRKEIERAYQHQLYAPERSPVILSFMEE